MGVITPQEAREKIAQQRTASGITEPRNLEEQAISLVGTDIYEKLVQGYTQKQWGRPCTELPSFIIRRLPVRFTFDSNYFNHELFMMFGISVLFTRLNKTAETDAALDRM